MPTRNLVPRVAGEGSIGTASRPFGAGHFDKLHINGKEVIPTMDLPGEEPNGVTTAPEGTFGITPADEVWFKSSGSGNTGWVKLISGELLEIDGGTL